MSTTDDRRDYFEIGTGVQQTALKISSLADHFRDGTTKEQVIEELPDKLTDEAGALIQLAAELEDLT
jgi:hypothetical protein